MRLGDILDYHRAKYNNCHKFFKAEYWQMYQKAKEDFAKYYRVKYPNAKIQARELKPYIRWDDLTEKFEEYGD